MLRYTDPRKIKVRFVVTSNTIIDNLQLFSCTYRQPCDLFHAPVHGGDVRVEVVTQPGRLTDAVVGRLQFAGLWILHRRTFKLCEENYT